MMEQAKKLFQAVDMTVGEPWKKIVIFTIPMLLGNIAQQLYNTVDSIVVGKYVGDNALAAVGSAGPILNLLLVLFVGISMGASIMVSQYFGAKQREELSQTIGNCITLTAIAVVIIMVLSVIIVRPLLELLDTPDSIIDWCTSYLLIMFLGSVGSAYYNILSGILRGLGDAFSALIYLLVATVLNIILDLVFVAKLGMGVSGVAWATIIAQAVSAVLCFMRGAGDTMTPMWISIVTTVIVRVPIAYCIAYLTRTAELPNGRQECIFISLLCSWLFGAIVTTIFYLRGNWKKKAING